MFSPTSINRQLTFRWLPENQVNPNITLSQFTMDVTLSDSYSTEFYDLAYPGVIMRIRLRRQIGYHIVQVNNVYTVQLFLLRMIGDSRSLLFPDLRPQHRLRRLSLAVALHLTRVSPRYEAFNFRASQQLQIE